MTSFRSYSFRCLCFTIFNTIILLSSGGFITYAHHSLIANDRKGTLIGLFFTVVLAIVFTYSNILNILKLALLFLIQYLVQHFLLNRSSWWARVNWNNFIYTQFIRISNYHLTSGHHVGLELSILY